MRVSVSVLIGNKPWEWIPTLTGIVMQYRYIDEVILYDNGNLGSVWGNRAFQKLFEHGRNNGIDMKYIRSPYDGKSLLKLRQLCLLECKGDVFFHMDGDMLLPVNFFAKMLVVMDRLDYLAYTIAVPSIDQTYTPQWPPKFKEQNVDKSNICDFDTDTLRVLKLSEDDSFHLASCVFLSVAKDMFIDIPDRITSNIYEGEELVAGRFLSYASAAIFGLGNRHLGNDTTVEKAFNVMGDLKESLKEYI